jgi:hypothetical protein
MPCVMQNYGPSESEKQKDALIEKLEAEGDKTTKYLCTVLNLIETKPVYLEDLPKSIQSWWTKHKKLDAARQSPKTKAKP